MRERRCYDKAKYHHDAADFPKDLPLMQAYVHSGMFMGWLADNDLIDTRDSSYADRVAQFKKREITCSKLYEAMGEGLLTDMLTEEGDDFAYDYFEFSRGSFISDYRELLVNGLPTDYHVADTWANYEKLRARIDERYRRWKGVRR
jgi:hypothetical protein